MARVADLAAIIVISFLLTFVWTTAAFDSWTAVFAVSVAASVMAAVLAGTVVLFAALGLLAAQLRRRRHTIGADPKKEK